MKNTVAPENDLRGVAVLPLGLHGPSPRRGHPAFRSRRSAARRPCGSRGPPARSACISHSCNGRWREVQLRVARTRLHPALGSVALSLCTPFSHFIPDFVTDSVALCPKRDRTLVRPCRRTCCTTQGSVSVKSRCSGPSARHGLSRCRRSTNACRASSSTSAVCRKQIAQGWPTSWARSSPLIGILSHKNWAAL